MKITLQDGLTIDFENASKEAQEMVEVALTNKRDEHAKQINQLVEAVFLTAAQNAIKHEVEIQVSNEVRKFFASKEGRNIVAQATKTICDRAVEKLLGNP